MDEYRCNNCNKLLFKGEFQGVVEIMCNRCKVINIKECREHQSE